MIKVKVFYHLPARYFAYYIDFTTLIGFWQWCIAILKSNGDYSWEQFSKIWHKYFTKRAFMSDICSGYYSLREKPCQVTKLVQLARKNVWASMFYFPVDKHSNIHWLKSRARNVWKIQNFAYIKLDLVIHYTANSTR